MPHPTFRYWNKCLHRRPPTTEVPVPPKIIQIHCSFDRVGQSPYSVPCQIDQLHSILLAVGTNEQLPTTVFQSDPLNTFSLRVTLVPAQGGGVAIESLHGAVLKGLRQVADSLGELSTYQT